MSNNNEAAAVAVDVGGTSLKGAAFGFDGRVSYREDRPTFGRGDAYSGLEALVASIINSAGTVAISGIGVATPGTVDAALGHVHFAANLGWENVALKEKLEQRFGVPTWIDHDARAAARAERSSHFGSVHYDDFIFIPIGTGVAASIHTRGEPIEGIHGAAGEFGHMQVVPGGEFCGCGQRGCIEAYSSAGSIVRRYQRDGSGRLASAEAVIAAVPHDEVAARIWNEAIEALSTGISSLVAVLDPSLVVIGGGLSNAGAVLLDPLTRTVGEKLGWRESSPILQSGLGSRAGLIGAGLLGWSNKVHADFAVNANSFLVGGDPSSISLQSPPRGAP